MSDDAPDTIDDRLLAERRHAELLARHYPALVDRARVRLRSEADAHDAVQSAMVRLVAELRRGKVYDVPFRVVAHQVLTWTIRGWFAARQDDPGPLPPDLAVDEDGFVHVEARLRLEQYFESLPRRDRDVMRLRWIDGEEISDIADQLGITPNAVSQALHRGASRLREDLSRG